ncbi:hypothetical protein RT95_20640 [Xanthomonas campestris]|nr:hypothetical protein RT95_20640 [Xanthomonas campestris]
MYIAARATQWRKAIDSAYYPGCPDADYGHWLRAAEVWPGSNSAIRGAQYRDDQLAGVDNSQQPARGEPRCGGQSGLNQAGDTHYLGNGQPSKLRARLRYTEHGSYWEVTHGVLHPERSVAFPLDQLLWVAGVRARQTLRQGGALQYAGPRQILTNGGW